MTPYQLGQPGDMRHLPVHYTAHAAGLGTNTHKHTHCCVLPAQGSNFKPTKKPFQFETVLARPIRTIFTGGWVPIGGCMWDTL